MAKADEAVDLLDKTISRELNQFKGVQPRESFIENTDKKSVAELLKFFESKTEDQKWDRMYHKKDQDNYVLADKAAAVSFMEAQHRELTRHYAGENEVSLFLNEQVGASAFLSVKDAIRTNVTDHS